MHNSGLALVFSVLMILSVASGYGSLTEANTNNAVRGLFIVVTFNNLVYDIEQIACKSDVIESIVPPGVDPHSYVLTEKDIQLISRADVVVSTGHAPFEERIKEYIEENHLNTTLIEIPRIPGIKILNNPETGEPNYHMPIYDPRNYIVFINYVAKTFADINRDCSRYYTARAWLVIAEVESLINVAENLTIQKLVGVGDRPSIQYGVSWLNIDTKYFIAKEHEVQSVPYERIADAMARGEVNIAIVTDPPVDAASKKLLELANEYSVPVLTIPSPLSQGSMVDKIKRVLENYMWLMLVENKEGSSQASGYSTGGRGGEGSYGLIKDPRTALLISLAISLVAVNVIYLRRQGRSYEPEVKEANYG